MTTVDEFYKIVKEGEQKFPLPDVYEDVFLGTFDASNGTFDGPGKYFCHSESLYDKYPDGNWPGDSINYVGNLRHSMKRDGDCIVLERIYTPETKRMLIYLDFVIINSDPKGWKVIINGRTVSFPSSQTLGQVSAFGSSGEVSWKISSGRKSYFGKVILHPVVGVGAFTIPFVPLLILYEPPCDRDCKSYAEITTSTSFTTELGSEVSYEKSTTKPATPSKYQSAGQAQGLMNSAASLLQNIPNPWAAGAAKVLSALASGLGSMSATRTEGSVEANGSSLRTTATSSTGLSTGENDGGPGIGDIIYFLRNVRMLWIALDGKLFYTPLGWEKSEAHSIYYIRSKIQARDKFYLENGNNIISLDPFAVGGLSTNLPSNRFKLIEENIDISGLGGFKPYGKEEEITSAYWSNKNTYTITVEDYRPGWLSFLGLGVKERETITTKMTQNSSNRTETSKKVTLEAQLHSDKDEYYCFDLYFDRVFGTYSFRWVPGENAQVLSGILTTSDGKPIASEKIELSVLSGTAKTPKKMTAYTNLNGEFRFHKVSSIPWDTAVKGALRVRNVDLQTIALKKKPVANIALKLPIMV